MSQSLLGHQSQVLQGCPLCGLRAPSCWGWAMISVGTMVGGGGALDSGPASWDVQLWLLWAHWYARLAPGMAGWGPDTTVECWCAGLAPWSGSHFGGDQCWPRLPAGWGGTGAALESQPGWVGPHNSVRLTKSDRYSTHPTQLAGWKKSKKQNGAQ